MKTAVLAIALNLLTGSLRAEDALAIVRKSVERDQSNWIRMRDYTWHVHEVETRLDGKGDPKGETSQDWETLVLNGQAHRRYLMKDGKPLSPAESRKQQEKLDATLAKLKRETPAEQKRRLSKEETDRRKSREFLREIPEIYNFTLSGERLVDGRPVWIVDAKPKPDYRPKHSDAKPLLKMEGTLWIDKAEYQWVRLDVRTTALIPLGLFLARVAPGARIVFEQSRINDELWLPKSMSLSGSARLALVAKLAQRNELTWSNYRKFQVDSKIVPTVE